MELIDFFVAMPALPAKLAEVSPPPFMSGDRTFFTICPPEIRDEIYSHVLFDANPTFNVPPPIKTSTLPSITAQLPPCLQANHQMIHEAISAYLRRTTLVSAHSVFLQGLMAGLSCNAWQSIRSLVIEDTAHSAEDVQAILAPCSGLRHLTIGVPASMVISTGRSSADKSHRIDTAVSKPFENLRHIFAHKSLRELSLVCNDGSKHYLDNMGRGLRDAFQAWAATFVDESRKKGKDIDVKVKIIPYKGFVHPRYEFGYYTVGRVTSYEYQDWFG
jgi:hypothetical protein